MTCHWILIIIKLCSMGTQSCTILPSRSEVEGQRSNMTIVLDLQNQLRYITIEWRQNPTNSFQVISSFSYPEILQWLPRSKVKVRCDRNLITSRVPRNIFIASYANILSVVVNHILLSQTHTYTRTCC